MKTKYIILNSTLHLSEFRDCIVRATNITDDCINASMEIFTQALLSAAGCMLKTVKGRRARQNKSSWFDTECSNMKKKRKKMP